MVLLSPINGMIRTLSGDVLPAGFMHDAVNSACKKGCILAIFSIPAILIVQLRSCEDSFTWQLGLNTKYGTAPVLVLVPVVDVVIVDVLVVSEALVVMAVPFVTGAVAFRTVKNTLECFTKL
jgi:hypothetical protein